MLEANLLLSQCPRITLKIASHCLGAISQSVPLDVGWIGAVEEPRLVSSSFTTFSIH